MPDQLCEQPTIEKIRYQIMHRELSWEVDKFQRENLGLVVAEVELKDDQQTIVLPDWVDREVTADARYYNTNLITLPFFQGSNP